MRRRSEMKKSNYELMVGLCNFLHLPCNNETEANTMDQRLPVDTITPETTDWTCKIQEQQVSIILYGDDIPKYENLFGLFETYLVSCAKVREPRSYSIQAAMYGWVADRYTIIEAVTNNNGSEAPLSAPTKLDTLSFSAIEEQRPGVEFGKHPSYILASFPVN
ncbi:hypothetical protein FXO37_20371 [Capsicum annuum]|nr:hypothetical protein FXO37_20371 [Capsicum annuum]